MPGKKLNYIEIENFRKIQFARIQPDPEKHTLFIRGNNGNGKTSASDGIIALVGGKKHFPKRRPIRDGQLHAHSEGSIGKGDKEIIIRREWNRKEATPESEIKEKTILRYANGKKITAVTSFLDDMLGSEKDLSFDPGNFILNKERQRDILLSMLGIDKILADNKEEYKLVFDKRTDINRSIRDQKGVIAEIPVIDKDIPVKLVSVNELAKEISEATRTNQKNEVMRLKYRNAKEDYEAIADKLLSLKSQIAILRDKQVQCAEKIEDLEEAENLKDVDISGIMMQLDSIEEQNKAISEANKQRDIRSMSESRCEEMTKESDGYTSELESIKTRGIQILKDADFPVEGLSVDDNDVLFNGMPFGEESDSRQRILSMDIALSRLPKDGFRFIRFRDASLFDDNALEEISKKAAKEDALLVLEVVGEDGPGILIENGLIVKNVPNDDDLWKEHLKNVMNSGEKK